MNCKDLTLKQDGMKTLKTGALPRGGLRTIGCCNKNRD